MNSPTPTPAQEQLAIDLLQFVEWSTFADRNDMRRLVAALIAERDAARAERDALREAAEAVLRLRKEIDDDYMMTDLRDAVDKAAPPSPAPAKEKA